MTSKSDHDLLVELHSMCGLRCAKVEKHDETLYGNGRMGLKTKVSIMWMGLSACCVFFTLGGGGILVVQWLRGG
jgi:hypothetical protein